MAKAPIPATKATSLPPMMRLAAPLPGTYGSGPGVAVPVDGLPVPEAVADGAVPLLAVG